MTTAVGDVLVIGLGSPHGDDRVGWAVVERLEALLPCFARARAVGGGLDLLACLEGQDRVIIVDAASPTGRPGHVHILEWPYPDLQAVRPLSTHGPGLVEALRLAEVLGRLPRRLRIYAIEADSLRPGDVLGPIVAAGVDAVASTILDDLAAHGECPALAGAVRGRAGIAR